MRSHSRMLNMFMKMNDTTYNFCDKIVLIFGGSRGIGREISLQFRASGAVVYCASRTNPALPGVKHLPCDMSRVEDVLNVFEQLKSVDFVINVAATNWCEPIDSINVQEWDRLMDINLRSFFVSCKAAVKMMKENGVSGRIVNISSIAGRHKSIVSGVHYTSSKYGIIGLTKQLAHEVAKDNILVNCVCPSQTMTEMLAASMTPEQLDELSSKIPVRRIATPREQAQPVLFLCSNAASYITGTTLDINGGQF